MSTSESQPSYPTPTRAAPKDFDPSFPPPPENKETAPFSVLSSLFERLQGERKPEKRYRLLNSWFNVHPQTVSYRTLELIGLVALAKRERLRSIPRPEAHLAVCESAIHSCAFYSLGSPPREIKNVPFMVLRRRIWPKHISNSYHWD